MALTSDYYIGVDVGTSSARAALTDQSGTVLKTATRTIETWNDRPDYYEQSSDDIWTACCKVVQDVSGDVAADRIKGIGFDATCSLVVLDREFKPLPVNDGGDAARDVIMWMDHRAGAQATRINETRHPVLRYIGGTVSVEMEMPKLMWLKERLPSTWSRVGHVFDLPDYLTWRSTGSLSRSLCSLVCKWNYQYQDDNKSHWPDDFLKLIGLEDLIDDNYAKIGSTVLPPGAPCGSGLTEKAASELGLRGGTTVATSMIDAHAGTLGCLASRVDGTGDVGTENRLVIVCGTSTCHMVSSREPRFVPGVWGPYGSAVVPGLWTNEAGQSAAGKLIDHVIETHPAYRHLVDQAETNDRHLHSELNAILDRLARARTDGRVGLLTDRLHVWPDYHGNRSPIADPNLRGMISGLTLSSGLDDLALLYLATVQALAYSTRHILESMTSEGHVIKSITACGGLSKNGLYIKTHADVTGIPITLPHEAESVLLGAAIAASCAAGSHASFQAALRAINGPADVVSPDTETRSYHEKKYRVFRAMLEHQRQYDAIMTA